MILRCYDALHCVLEERVFGRGQRLGACMHRCDCSDGRLRGGRGYGDARSVATFLEPKEDMGGVRRVGRVAVAACVGDP